MKRILVLFFILLIFAGGVFAKSKKDKVPAIKYNKSVYTLRFSDKSRETNGFINEYYKPNQTYASWTELIGVHHFPNSYSPIEHAKEFSAYLNSSGIENNLVKDEETNSAIIDFIIIDRQRLPIILEFNVFKFIKDSVCGTIGIQYAKRYRINNPLLVDKVRYQALKSRKKHIKLIQKLKTPALYKEIIDENKYINKEGVDNSLTDLLK